MDDEAIYSGIESTEEYGNGDDSTLDINLHPTGDESSGFHTKNDPRPGMQWHRNDITQRKGALGIKCNMTDVIHRKWVSNSDEYATIIVLLFRFDVKNTSRNISRVDITINFFGGDVDDPYSRPEVYAISFDDNLSLVKRIQSELVTKGVEGTAGLNAAQVAELSGNLKWEKTTTQEVPSYTRVIGNTYRNTYDFGEDDQVNWILLENEKFGTGVPVTFRAGILLKRKDMSPFKCEVDIKLKADIRSRMEDFFGRGKPKDDLVLFNSAAHVLPRKLRAVKQDQLDVENLKSLILHLFRMLLLCALMKEL